MRQVSETIPYRIQKLISDAWCTAFVLPRIKGAPAITAATFEELKNDPGSCPEALWQEIDRIAVEYEFFHWHIEFPEVYSLPKEGEKPENSLCGWNGGFDVNIGNPPWDRVKLQEKEWFAERVPEIANAPRATNERTMIAAVMPRTAVVYSIGVVFLFGHSAQEAACLLAAWNSFSFDWIARQKTSGNHITDYIIRQLPLHAPATFLQSCPWSGNIETINDWILPRVIELTYTTWNLEPFANDCAYTGPPLRWSATRRFILRSELDAAFFHLYGIARDDVEYILKTFAIGKGNDAQFRETNTKRVILEIYDAMAHAIKTGEPYQTLLDPPPADPRLAHDPVTRDPLLERELRGSP